MDANIDVGKAVQRAYDHGMFQLYDEILPFALWLAQRQPVNIAEIGTHLGGTAVLFCELASGKFISIDLPDGPFGGLSEEECKKRNARLKKSYPNFIGILGDSHKRTTMELLRGVLLRGDGLDLLFIDGDHSYQGVKKDYEIYKQFVKPGGAIAFHDIEDTEFHRSNGCEVSKLWQELTGEKIEFSVHESWGGIGVLITPQ